MNYFKLHNKEIPWGDNGEVLFAGLNDREQATGQFVIQRTGPFMPRIWCGGCSCLFVVDDMKMMLEQSGLKGLFFQPAIKKRIVLLDWKKWDSSASEPQIYPSGAEPENYILRRKHNQELSDKIGELWAVIPGNPGLEIHDEDTDSSALVAQSIGDADFLIPNFSWNIYVSEKFKNWLSQNDIDDVCIESESVPIKNVSAMEFETIRAKEEQYRIEQEKWAKMTKADQQKYYRLGSEARKLAEERHKTKSEVAKARRTAKAIACFQEAQKLCNLDVDDEALLATLLDE